MACQDVGSTNSDIAGLGIVVAFAFQAGLSLALSIWSLLFWKSAILSIFDPPAQTLSGDFVSRFYLELANFTNVLAGQLPRNRALSMPIERLLAAFSSALTGYGNLIDLHNPRLQRVLSGLYRRDEVARRLQKQCIDSVLSTISDIQIVNANALLIAALVQNTTLSLYHMHIVYDTVCFTGVSVCASLVNVLGHGHRMSRSRYLSILILALLYLAYTIVFGVRLMKWDDSKSGCCYNTHLVAAHISGHPGADQAYIAVTSLYFLFAIAGCVQYENFFSTEYLVLPRVDIGRYKPEQMAPLIVGLAMLQYPLHLYFVIALRASNESLLAGDSENAWGFGQIVALVLSAASLVECAKAISEYKNIAVQRRHLEIEMERTAQTHRREADRGREAERQHRNGRQRATSLPSTYA